MPRPLLRKDPNMIYFKLMDNLGNWLFRYAAALSTGLPVRGYLCNPDKKESFEYFGAFFKDLETVDKLPDGIRTYSQPDFSYSPFPDEIREGDWMLNGYFQSARYFNEALVRKTLVPPPDVVEKLTARYGDWLSRPNVTGISVRRGDYLKYPEYHPFVGKRFFRKAIRSLSETRDFIVCSDDIPWCREFFPRAFPDRNFLIADGDPWHDLILPSLCRHNIISNSSFSWWGAWLNTHPGRRVLAPSRWFGFGYRINSTKDLFPPEFEVIPCHQDAIPFLYGIGRMAAKRLGLMKR